MQQNRSRIGTLAGFAWLLSVALACGDDPYCTQSSGDCSPLNEALEDSFNDEDAPCDSLSDDACQRSSHCIMDSVCKAPACSGPGCTGTCELVHACVSY